MQAADYWQQRALAAEAKLETYAQRVTDAERSLQLGQQAATAAVRYISIDQRFKVILEAITAITEVSVEAITSGQRDIKTIEARMIAYRLLRDADYSLAAIGRVLGNRDHTTISDGIRSTAQRAKKDRTFAAKLTAARKKAGELLHRSEAIND